MCERDRARIWIWKTKSGVDTPVAELAILHSLAVGKRTVIP